MLASTLIAKAADLYNDASFGTISEARWLVWLNEAELEICRRDPSANVESQSVLLVAGHRQTLASDTTGGFYLSHNMGSGGTTVGADIREVDEALLNASYPGWRSATASTTVEEYVYDESKPFEYSVSPPVHASTPVYVWRVRGVAPTALTSSSQAINLKDKYQPLILDWMMYRVWSIDSAAPSATEKKQAHFAAFERFFV